VSKKRSFDLSQSYPGHLIAVLGHHREVKCTFLFSNCEPVDEDDDDRKHPARREVPCASPPVNEVNDDRKHHARQEVPCASPPVNEVNDDRKHPARREVPCTSPSVNEDNEDENDAVMKIFLMAQDSIDLEKPTKTKFAIMWDAMKKMHEPLVIESSAEADNQFVEIIRKKAKKQTASSHQ
jgi:hypothetical protein